jgi:hypothetical protein
MTVQTNFRAVDMPGAAKAVEVVVEKKVASAPKAKTTKVAPVVAEEVVVDAPAEDVVEEVAAPVEE